MASNLLAEIRPSLARRRPAWLGAAFSVLTGTGLVVWHASFYDSWIVDDAAITFAYARSFSEGLGPVVHPGADTVEGYSNPTWLLLLAVGRLFGVFDHGSLFGIPDYVGFPKALAVLCCAGILVLCFGVARRVTSRPALATFAIGVVLAAIPSFVIWCFSGLENSLFALAAVGLAALLFHASLDRQLDTSRVAVLAGLIAALAALTRPDGLIYLLAYPLVLLRGVRLMVVSAVAFAVPFGAYLTWRYFTFGLFVPNTAVAKSQDVPTPHDLLRVEELALYIGVPAVIVLIAAVAMTDRSNFRPLLVPLGLALVAYGVLEPDWMTQHRFATPIWALGALVGVLAIIRARKRALLAGALVLAFVPSGIALAGSAGTFRDNPTFPMCLVAERFGFVFNRYADIFELRQASLLAPDLGGLSMTTRLRIVDMAGLADTRIARYTGDDDKAGLRDYVFEEVRPTFITSHGVWNGGTGVALDPRLRRDYLEIYNRDTASDWIRKDVVSDVDRLRIAREYAAHAIPEVDRKVRDLPRRQCGATLRRGQTQ